MNKPLFLRKCHSHDDGHVRCWACKTYIACGEYFVAVVAVRATKRLPVIAFCADCGKHIGEHALSRDERGERDAEKRGFNWASEHGWEDVLDVSEASPTTGTRVSRRTTD